MRSSRGDSSNLNLEHSLPFCNCFNFDSPHEYKLVLSSNSGKENGTKMSIISPIPNFRIGNFHPIRICLVHLLIIVLIKKIQDAF